MQILRSKHTITPLPYWIYHTTCLFSAIIGFGTTVYLTISHYRIYTDMGYKSFCALSKSVNCDTVSQSAYAVFFGMPLAVWGCIGYLVIFALLSLARRRKARPKRIWATIFTVSTIFCAFDLYLAWVSLYRIKSACIMCILTYCVNFALLYFSWITMRRFNQSNFWSNLNKDIQLLRSQPLKSLIVIVSLFLCILAGTIFYPDYWHYESMPSSTQLSMGHTSEGNPWIGAQNPQVTIHEYADYLCFQCAKMHFYLRQLIRQYPEKIRLVHHHFPMDKAYNPLVKNGLHAGAGQMALLALYADSKGRFWQMNDLLFEFGRRHEDVGLHTLTEKLDLDFNALRSAKDDPVLLKYLWKDIRSGLKNKVSATPTFIIDGKTYIGMIPAESLPEAIR